MKRIKLNIQKFADNEVSIDFTVATSKFEASMARLEGTLKKFQSSLSVNATLFGKASSSVAVLTSRNNILNGTIATQKEMIKQINEYLKIQSQNESFSEKTKTKLASQIDKINSSMSKHSATIIANNGKIEEKIRKQEEEAEATRKATEEAEKNTQAEKENLNSKEKLISSIGSLSSSFSNLIMKLRSYATSIKRTITQIFNNFISKSIDTSEELNLFNVVFDNMQKNGEKTFSELGKKATQFQNTLNEKFGTNKKETMRYQGLFQAMGESAGINEEIANVMSENMTKLSYDLASLYNTTETKAAESLRAGVYAGQTKPLRNYGIDVTQTSMKPILSELGIEKSVNELTQAEKELLRYIATLRQAQNAMGDFANTIESPANQLKVFRQQVYEMSVAIGNLFVGAFARILPYANAIVMVIKEVVQAIASFFGIEMQDYNTSIAGYGDDLEDYSEDLGGVADSASGASDAIKELKRQTLGFDQINNLTSPTPTSGSGGSGGGGGGVSGGIDQRLLDAIKGYRNGMEEVSMKATKIRDQIMEWLGFTKEVDDETGEVNFKLKDGWQRIHTIGTIIGGVLILGTIIKIAGKVGEILITVGKIIKAVEALGSSGLASTLNTVGIVLAIVAGIVENILIIKDTADKISSIISGDYEGPKGFLDTVITIGEVLLFLLTPLYRLIDTIIFIVDTIKSIKKVGLEQTIRNIAESIKNTTGIDLTGVIDAVIKGIGYVTSAIEFVGNIFDIVVTFIKGVLLGVADWINDNVVQPIIDFFTPIVEWFSKLWDSISKTAEDIWNNIVGIIQGVIETIEILWGLAKDWLNEHIFQPIGEFFGKVWNKISEVASSVWDTVKSKAKEAWEGIKNVFSPVVDWFKDKFQKAWEGVKNVFSTGGKIFTGIKEGIESTFKTVVNGIIGGLNKVIEVPFNGINAALRKIKNISIAGKKPFEGKIYEVSVPQIPLLANGGMPTTGEMFIAREAGPEMVGRIGNRTTVANNDQIVKGIEQGVYNAVTSAISNGGLGTVQIDLHTDEGVVVDRINKITRQTGNCPINI